MSNQLLKSQHLTIRELLSELEKELRTGNIEEKAFDISLKISKLSGVLTLHLRSEDNYLYPNLKDAKEPQVRETAAKLYKEMGDLAEEFNQYKSTYMSATKIKANPQEFHQVSLKIIQSLKQRLDLEDRKLYVLI
ncbi:MAG: hemerythrin domain-containing protein [Desulfitobacterium sp.]|nr:hemerythrin domain-containing protein [Desulfitobacterium sp.]